MAARRALGERTPRQLVAVLLHRHLRREDVLAGLRAAGGDRGGPGGRGQPSSAPSWRNVEESAQPGGFGGWAA